MSKKKINEIKKSFSTMLRPSQIEEIKKLANKLEITPSMMASNLIEMGIDDVKTIDGLGFIKITLLDGDIAKRIKNKAIKGQQILIEDLFTGN